MASAVLENVDIRIVQGPRVILRSLNVDLNPMTTFKDVLLLGLQVSSQVPEESISVILENPITISLHPTAERTVNTAIGVRCLTLTCQSRCRTEQQRCVLFRIYTPEVQEIPAPEKLVMFGSPDFKRMEVYHLPEHRSKRGTRNLCFNRLIDALSARKLGFQGGEHEKLRKRLNTRALSSDKKKRKSAGAGYAHLQAFSELLSYYVMHKDKFNAHGSTSDNKLPGIFASSEFTLPLRSNKPAALCSTEKIRDLLTIVRDSISGMWTRNKGFQEWITDVHKLLDRLVLFCDRRTEKNERTVATRGNPETCEAFEGTIFFPLFCSAASTPKHGGVNRVLKGMKLSEPLMVDDKFVLASVSRRDIPDSKLWEHRKKYVNAFVIYI
jgi:hypothetical protein